MNIALFSPNKNPYSETFIQAHKHYLKGNIFYYYGNLQTMSLESGDMGYSKSHLLRWRVYRKLFGKPNRYINEKRLEYSLKFHQIDVVLVEYGNHAHHLLPVFQKTKIPFVVHFHGYDASVNKVVKACLNYREVFAKASKVVAVSKVMRQKLLDLGCPKIKLVYNVYGPQPEFETIIPNFSKKQFLAIGRFTDKKAPYYTILAFKHVVKKHPEALLLMAGEGELLNTCKNLVNQHGIAKQVKFLGVITPKWYRELLSESLAFVQHSITADDGNMEGTPLAVLEASVAGLPVIATKHGGIPDVIKHGKTGLLSDEHDVETMASNMLEVLDDIDYAQQLGASGKQRILEHFSMQRHIEALNTVLQDASKI